jgi:hypothetical protein
VSNVTGAPSRALDARKLMSQGTIAGGSLRASSRGAVRKLLAGNGPVTSEVGAITARLANGVRELSRRLESLVREQVELELDQFLGRLAASVDQARVRFSTVDDEPDVRFALDDLGPQRVEAAKRFFSPCSAAQYVALREFLTDAAAGVDYDVAQAEDADDVGDALLRGLENLHGFVLSKDLVSPAYRHAQEEPVLAFLPVREPRRRPDWPTAPMRVQSRERRFTRDENLHQVRVA